ncbi:uncharacterized protein LOC141655957 [Silene latifolia]|uniref:uncharacterized protein LOC141655957 n=1 Tax=Silene latifolia TaxID=37657 RepID=UPI003D786AE6
MAHLITNFDSGDDKGWAQTYMFIKADSIAPDLDYLNYPAVEGVNDWVNDPDAEGSADRIAAFMALPEEERAWPACLGQAAMPRFKKAKLSTYKPVKSTKVPGASSSGSKFFCLFCHSVFLYWIHAFIADFRNSSCSYQGFCQDC